MSDITSSPENSTLGLRKIIDSAKEIELERGRGKKDAVLRAAIQQKEEEIHLLQAQSEIDPLTGLLNQNGFLERLNLEVERAKRSENKIALFFFDLNGLKKINDELGHAIGDEYIKMGADILRNSFRPTDLIARRGDKADEFVVAVPIENKDAIKPLYQRVEELTIEANQNWLGYEIVFPAGATLLNFNDIQKSLEIADQVMYQAKEQSRISGHGELQVYE